MEERIERVIQVAAHHNNEIIILGAWGCGVFRNDPSNIANPIQKVLAHYPGAFRKVIFAILDFSKDEKFYRPFQKAFT